MSMQCLVCKLQRTAKFDHATLGVQMEGDLKVCRDDLVAAEEANHLAMERRKLAEVSQVQQDATLQSANAQVAALQAEAAKRKKETGQLQRELFEVRSACRSHSRYTPGINFWKMNVRV